LIAVLEVVKEYLTYHLSIHNTSDIYFTTVARVFRRQGVLSVEVSKFGRGLRMVVDAH
jgi:hypothetical protein